MGQGNFLPKERKDYTGKKFHFLTAISYHEKKHGKSHWLVKCDCGKIFSVAMASVSIGHTKSCGCKKGFLLTQKQTIPNGVGTINMAFQNHKSSARKRKIDSRLTREQYDKLVKNPCYYCGEISIRKNTHTGAEVLCNSVDRLNNEKFYSIENSVPCCFQCQVMKMDYTEKEFKEKIEKLYFFRRS